jgi:hypothetical protein
MLRSLTARQFVEWIEFGNLEPFSEERADLRTASIVATLANVNRKKGARRVTLKDACLLFGDSGNAPGAPKPQKDWRVLKAALSAALSPYQKES